MKAAGWWTLLFQRQTDLSQSTHYYYVNNSVDGEPVCVFLIHSFPHKSAVWSIVASTQQGPRNVRRNMENTNTHCKLHTCTKPQTLTFLSISMYMKEKIISKFTQTNSTLWKIVKKPPMSCDVSVGVTWRHSRNVEVWTQSRSAAHSTVISEAVTYTHFLWLSEGHMFPSDRKSVV